MAAEINYIKWCTYLLYHPLHLPISSLHHQTDHLAEKSNKLQWEYTEISWTQQYHLISLCNAHFHWLKCALKAISATNFSGNAHLAMSLAMLCKVFFTVIYSTLQTPVPCLNARFYWLFPLDPSPPPPSDLPEDFPPWIHPHSPGSPPDLDPPLTLHICLPGYLTGCSL